LVPFPQVVAMLNGHLDWMQQLGYAVTHQQEAVLDAIQRLRRQAQKAGSLKTTEQQRVVIEEETIVIEPASS
jgi:ABC-type phosphate/phosphonate transport system ATPase subunit